MILISSILFFLNFKLFPIMTDKEIKDLDIFKMTSQEAKELAILNLTSIRESNKKWEKEWEKLRKSQEEITKKFDTLGKLYGNVSHNIGSVAENFFFTGLEDSKQIASIHLDKIERNLKTLNGEYDIVGLNKNSLVVISVKHILRKVNVEKFISKELKQFAEDFKAYKDHKIYGAVAGMDIEKGAIKAATQADIFVLTQAGKHIKILNPSSKPKYV